MSARYIVRAVKFTCLDESGADFFGSDEPYWVFSTRGQNGEVHTTRSREFGDVDSGDTRSFAKNSNAIIWPPKGATKGAPGPIALSIQLYEADQGDKDETVKKTHLAFDLAEKAPFVGSWVKEVPGIVRDQLTDLIGDDLMGSKTLLFPANRLERQLPVVGASLTEKHRFGGNSGDLPFEIAGGPDYDLFIQITRVA